MQVMDPTGVLDFQVLFHEWLRKTELFRTSKKDCCIYSSGTIEKVYREVDVAQRGDDSTAEAYDQRSVGHQHELCSSPHGNATSKGGILNVHLWKTSSIRHIRQSSIVQFGSRMRIGTMSSFPCFWKRLEMATVVSTVEARAR